MSDEGSESIGDFSKELDEYEIKWKKEHPVKAYIDDKFPKGYAEYRVSYVLSHPWEILREWKRQIKWAWQRVFRKWDDRAVWSINYYLAEILPPMLKKLRKEKVGIPMFCFEELPYEDENTYSYSEESTKIAEERWNKILDEMIEGFELYNKLWEQPSYEKEREEYKKVEKALDLLKIYFESLWD